MSRKDALPAFFLGGICLIFIAAIYFPRALAFFPLLLGVCGFTGLMLGAQRPAPMFSWAYMIWISIISGLCLLSTLWSPEPLSAFERSLKIPFTLVASVLLLTSAQFIPLPPHKNAPLIIALVLGLCMLMCSIELAFNMPLYRILHAVGEKRINTSVMNRSLVFFVLCLFPVLGLLFQASLTQQQKRLCAIGLTACAALMLTLSQSQSAQMGFIVGGLTLLLFPVRNRHAFTLLWGGIVAALLLTPLLSILGYYAFASNVEDLAFLKNGYAAERLEIWNFVSSYALQNPLYGFGFDAARYIESFPHDHIYFEDDTVLHPHNFAVQLWLEFGILGAITASALMVWIIRNILLMPSWQARFSLALLLSTLSVAATGYGLWQSWWQGALVLLLALNTYTLKNSQTNSL